ncbi:ABC transporter ATP-binding protein [Petrotoga sp. 9PWA.NaAc.5.4]|uniref:ABC transporter ATP-binding protein n=1 Tax=Petrotoga sp. 9PWA.NaAc.5.4 TaxID=1434328 RepID=UPI000CB950EF|nr:ABC transporter ATP-binding protein [Petrotoga sp. 9PWA.NaAc.5.4]PNR96979.1 multidrug ABC transporter ATP-binding protein [Petrotoga sp. 9PWA.NaAc.5.4]
MTALEVKNLVKNYGSFEAVKNISFEVKEREIFGLIGPNGAGKTTTLRTIATLIQITFGSIKVYNYDVKKDSENVRRIISYLPEDAGAYRNLRGKEYLEFIAKFFTKKNADFKKMVEKGIQIAKLGDKINDKIETYSKGMIRKLLIGRTMMTEPKLAILDEPSSGLDVINAREIRNMIKESVKIGGAVLLSSHNMLEVEYMCDRVALINKGTIIEIGTPDELKTKYHAQNIEDVFMEVVK